MSGHSHGGHAEGGHDCCDGPGHSHGGSDLKKPLLEGLDGHSHSGTDVEQDRDDHGHGGHGHGGHTTPHTPASSVPDTPSRRKSHHGRHKHAHGHGGHEEMDDKQRLKQAVLMALFFMFIEIFGGVVANSLAIITDAAHMLSDVGGFIVSLLALQLSASGATKEYTYGFKQAEVLGALLSIAIVWCLTGVLLWEALPRFIEPQNIDAPIMFYISVVGFLVNLILFKVLGHNHSHGGQSCGHGHGGEDDGLALQAAVAHVIGDIVQSLGVCAASVCIWTKPFDLGEVCTDQWDGTTSCVSRWNYADPMCTVLFGVMVLYTTKSTIVRGVETLMGKAPKHISHAKFSQELTQIDGVDSVHDLHLWSLGSKDVLCSAHLVITSRSNATEALHAAMAVAQKKGIAHSTFQIEIKGEFDPSRENLHGCYDNPSKSEAGGHGESHAGHDHGHAGHDQEGHAGHDCGHAH